MLPHPGTQAPAFNLSQAARYGRAEEREESKGEQEKETQRDSGREREKKAEMS